MKHSLTFCCVLLVLTACAPAASPAPTQAPAAPQPTSAPAQMPAPAAQPTIASLATALPEFRPPQSGGVLNPPTPIPTTPGKSSSVTSGQSQPSDWLTYRDSVTGLNFQHPPDWLITLSRNNQNTLESVLIARANQPLTNTASILIDVRQKQGDLLTWLGRQLPTGSLLLDGSVLENGAASYKNYNARLGSTPAVFVYTPAHNKRSAAAALYTADDQYFYQITYLGGTPENSNDRAQFLRLLNTLTLSNTSISGVTLPATTFTTGVDLNP